MSEIPINPNISNDLALKTCQRILVVSGTSQQEQPALENLANAYVRLFKAADDYVKWITGIPKGEFNRNEFPWTKYEVLKKVVEEG